MKQGLAYLFGLVLTSSSQTSFQGQAFNFTHVKFS